MMYDHNFSETYLRLSGEEHRALRKDFQVLEDYDHGRWRSPDLPDLVVVPLRGPRTRIDSPVVVIDTSSPRYASYVLEADGKLHSTFGMSGSREGEIETAAKQFRAAERKARKSRPWLAAKPGEVWTIGIGKLPKARALVTSEERDGKTEVGFTLPKGMRVSIDSKLIASGTRELRAL